MGDIANEVWDRVQEDERATLACIEALEVQLAGERRHLDEARLFQAMLKGYDLTRPASVQPSMVQLGAVEPSPVMAEVLSEARAEELDRLNRLFGLPAGADTSS